MHGLAAALMIVTGYYGELVITGDLAPRWLCWGVSMFLFLYIVAELMVGLSNATNNGLPWWQARFAPPRS